jgi:hypothetical protein
MWPEQGTWEPNYEADAATINSHLSDGTFALYQEDAQGKLSKSDITCKALAADRNTIECDANASLAPSSSYLFTVVSRRVARRRRQPR